MTSPNPYRHLAFGLSWQSDEFLEQFASDPNVESPADVFVVRKHDLAPARKVMATWARTTIFDDGFRFRIDESFFVDFFSPDRLEIRCSTSWQSLPPHFYGTVAAGILAYRNTLPLHGSAVERDGRALLLTGEGGSGKSSIAAMLVARGWRLVSDDLSVVRLDGRSRPTLSAGRTDIRLVEAVASQMSSMIAVARAMANNNSREKIRVLPYRVAQLEAPVLQHVFFLDRDENIGSPRVLGIEESLRRLSSNIFRPRLMARLPGGALRSIILLGTASGVKSIALPTPPNFGIATAADQAERIEELIS